MWFILYSWAFNVGMSTVNVVERECFESQVPKHEGGEVERLEKLLNKYERGQLRHIDWLDRLAFKSIEKIKETESKLNGGTHLHLIYCTIMSSTHYQLSLS